MKTTMFRVLVTIVLALAVLLPAGVRAQDGTPAAFPAEAFSAQGGDLEAATMWLIDQQLEDGSFAGFSGEADAGTTVDAVIALAAAESRGVDVGTALDDAVAYLATGDVALVYEQVGVGQAAKLVLALVAVGEDPANFATTNPLAIVQNGQDDETGVFGTGIYDHAYAMMALAATGSEVPASAITALESTQTEVGGWAFDGSTDALAADSNTTSMVIQALVATGNGNHAMVQGGLSYILTTLDDEGSAAYSPGAEADANSTALVAQVYIATQGDATSLLGSLQMFQNQSGAYFYQNADPSDNMFTTLQVIPVVAGYALPIAPEAGATPVASMLARAA